MLSTAYAEIDSTTAPTCRASGDDYTLLMNRDQLMEYIESVRQRSTIPAKIRRQPVKPSKQKPQFEEEDE